MLCADQSTWSSIAQCFPQAIVSRDARRVRVTWCRAHALYVDVVDVQAVLTSSKAASLSHLFWRLACMHHIPYPTCSDVMGHNSVLNCCLNSIDYLWMIDTSLYRASAKDTVYRAPANDEILLTLLRAAFTLTLSSSLRPCYRCWNCKIYKTMSSLH